MKNKREGVGGYFDEAFADTDTIDGVALIVHWVLLVISLGVFFSGMRFLGHRFALSVYGDIIAQRLFYSLLVFMAAMITRIAVSVSVMNRRVKQQNEKLGDLLHSITIEE